MINNTGRNLKTYNTGFHSPKKKNSAILPRYGVCTERHNAARTNFVQVLFSSATKSTLKYDPI